MKKREKVSHYYKELLSSCLYPDDKINAVLEYIGLRKSFKKIIESNNEYLLTKGVIWYIANPMTDHSIDRILKLANNDTLLSFIAQYIDDISFDSFYYYHIYENQLNEYEKSIFEHFNETIDNFEDNDVYDLFTTIFRFIAAYVYLNKETIDDFDSYIKPYLINPIDKLDELLLQGVCTIGSDEYTRRDEYFWHDEELLNYVVSRLNNNIQKVIR